MGQVSAFHPPVAGKTRAEDFNQQRRAVGTSAQWVAEHGRPQRHGRPPLPPSPRAPGVALVAAILLAVDYGANAEAVLRTRGEQMPHGGPRPNPQSQRDGRGSGATQAAGNATALSPAPARPAGGPPSGPAPAGGEPPHPVVPGLRPSPASRHPRAAGPARTAATASMKCKDDHSKQIHDAIQAPPSRRGVGEEVIRREGHDPHEEVSVTDHMPLGVGGASIPAKMSRIDVYLDDQISVFPFFHRDVPDEVKKLPDLNKLFDQRFSEYIGEVAASFSEAVSDKLSQMGIAAGDDASILTVHGRVMASKGGHFEMLYPQGQQGYLLKITQGGEARYFALSNKLCGLVTPVPADEAGRNAWLAQHADLFFEADVQNTMLPAASYSARPHKEGLDANSAVQESALDIVSHAILPLKDEAFGETDLEAAIHLARSAILPYYEAGRELSDGEIKEALKAAGLETLVLAGGRVIKGGAQTLTKGVRKAFGKGKSALKGAADAVGDALAGRAKPSGRGVKATHAGLPMGAGSGRSGRLKHAASEVVRTFSPGAQDLRSPSVTNDLKEIGALVRGDRQIQKFLSCPREGCEAALEPVIAALKGAGYETRVRGMYLWSNANIDAPKNHFLVLAKKHGVDYAVDVTAGQFSEFGFSGALINTEEAWAKTLHDAARRTLIKYRDFKTPQAARSAFHPLKAVGPTDALEGSVILSSPRWYGVAKKTVEIYKFIDRKSGIYRKAKVTRYHVTRQGRG